MGDVVVEEGSLRVDDGYLGDDEGYLSDYFLECYGDWVLFEYFELFCVVGWEWWLRELNGNLRFVL